MWSNIRLGFVDLLRLLLVPGFLGFGFLWESLDFDVGRRRRP